MHPAYCSSPKDLTTIGLSSVPIISRQQLTSNLLHRPFIVCDLISSIPKREASNGFMSKISTPCIFPKISNRSRPVACSRSVGIVPGAAPGPMRSASLLISANARQYPYNTQKASWSLNFSFLPWNFLILPSLDPLVGVGAASPMKPVC